MTVSTYHFQEVRRSRTDKFKCRCCGKRFQRTAAATATVNPFNKNTDGRPKTYSEIWKELGTKVDAMKTDPTCACGQAADLVQPKPLLP